MKDVVYKSGAAAVAVEARYREALAAWPVPNDQVSLDTRQGKTFVVSCGPEQAPPVVLLHGAQANSAAWLPEVPRWAERFRLHAVDMIGEAGFSARVRPALDDDAHALWLEDVFVGLGLAHAAIVGTSLGGWLALDYASRRPAFVDALVLISPAGIGRQKNFLLTALPLLLLGAWGKRKIREKVFGPPSTKMPANLAPIADLMDLIGRAIRPRVVSIPRLTVDQLRSLSMPMLAILGERDALIDSHDTRSRLEREVPRAKVRFVSGGYHFLPDESDHIQSFLEDTLSITERCAP